MGRLDDVLTTARLSARRGREAARDGARRVVDPEKFRSIEPSRVEQVMALFFVGPIVVVSLVIVKVLNQVMTDVLLGPGTVDPSQEGIAGFMVTGITAGAFLMMAWIWFQFVKTAGFGWFTEGGLWTERRR